MGNGPKLRRIFDDMVAGRLDPRYAWMVLGAAMVVSAVYCLYMTRGSTFTGDEYAWIAFSPFQDFRVSIEPHSGHLIFTTLWLYKAILNTIGTDYLTFRLLTLGTVFLAVGLLFIWTRRRVGPWVALAPCLVLLFFGSDAGNLLQGIGFTIMLAVSLGMLALVALDRADRRGDIVACAALTLGVVSFTLILPFVAGAAVAILISKERWRRIWVVAIPIAIYLAWRVWLLVENIEVPNGSAHLSNVLLMPSWTFQSLAGILSALTGFNYNFETGSWLAPGEMAGPALALGFLALVGWRIRTGKMRSWFWVAVTVMLALFASQVLGWIPAVRTPATSRYLYPGAFVVILVLAEAFRGYQFSRTSFTALWLVAFCAFATNVAFVKDSGRALRERTPAVSMEVTASALVNSAYPYLPGEDAQPLVDLVSDPGVSVTDQAQKDYGGLAMSETDLIAQPDLAARADAILAGAFGTSLVPDKPGRFCQFRPTEKAGPNGKVETTLAPGGAVLTSQTAGKVSLRRFGQSFSVPVGQLEPGKKMLLYVPADDSDVPWRLSASVPSLDVCDVLIRPDEG
ncbi:MAG: hypothetical protein WBP55_05355 [Solirubrobacterales bacterium]